MRKLFKMFHVTTYRGAMAENVTNGNILDHRLHASLYRLVKHVPQGTYVSVRKGRSIHIFLARET